MATHIGRTQARTLRDVTNITAEELCTLNKETLDLAAKPRVIPIDPAPSQVICIASGKGGTGKTVVTTNLAVSLAALGLNVLLFDADLGLANAHLLLGVSPEYDISAVFTGDKRLDEIVLDCAPGLRLIPGGSGFSELAELKDGHLRHFAFEFRKCEAEADIVLVDLSAGISPQVMRFLNAAHDVLLVTTTDVTAMLDAYATIKSLAKLVSEPNVKLLINRVRDRSDAIVAFKKIKTVVARHTPNTQLSFFGWLPQNWYVQDSVFRRQPVVTLHPKSFVTSCFKTMAGRIKSANLEWRRFVSSFALVNSESHLRLASFSSKLGQMVFE